MTPIRPDEPPTPIVGFDTAQAGAARGAIVVRYDGKDYAMCPEPLSDARDEHDRREENLHFGANPTLERIRIHYGVKMMMESAIHVARYYGVGKEELLELWAKHYGPGFILKGPPPAPEPPISEVCLRCGRHAGFTWDDEKEWFSDCCGFGAVDPTREPDA